MVVVDCEAEAKALGEALEVAVEVGSGVRLLDFVARADVNADVVQVGEEGGDPVGVALELGLGDAVRVEVSVVIAVGVAVWVPDAVEVPLSVEDGEAGGLRDAVKLLVLGPLGV